MNLVKCKWIKFKNPNIKIIKENNGIRIINNSDAHGFLICFKIFKNSQKKVKINFRGKVEKGNGAIFQQFDLKKEILSETSMNATSITSYDVEKYISAIKIFRKSEVFIEKLDLEFVDSKYDEFSDICDTSNDILIITPSYPTEENKYFGGFVHSRVKAYKEQGIKFDLVCGHDYKNTCMYTFEGIDVTRTSFAGLREILTKKKYKTILVHFFDSKYANILDAVDLKETNLFLWVHGPETLYWDWSKMTDPYFVPETPLSSYSTELFEKNDELIRRYNSYSNVHWIFVSEWIKKRSEELINIKFNNSAVIPNFIDSENFNFVEKDPEQRKKIFFIRRFDDINKYAIDIDVRAILELSHRKCFNDLEFYICGTGNCYDKLVAPLRRFKNVHLVQKFMDHSEIAKVHKENGIALFATRYDAQGVSMCEAAMSGLVVVSSDNEAIAEFIPNNEGLLCDTENYTEYADVIEKLYNDEKLFKKLSAKCHQKVYDKCNFNQTIQKEIDLINSIKPIKDTFKPVKSSKILSIIIPSYNVAKYLKHGVDTILNHKNANKIQVIIVNDGSKDNTINVAKKLESFYSPDNICIVDKPNGGHGSTINEGLKRAVGKYVRIMDGDDWVNNEDMEKLITILEKEDTDVVLTDYSEDIAYTSVKDIKQIYQVMIPGKVYNFDELCYDGYGFEEYGPILATANFRTELLKDRIKLTEKCFYVDMEFDAYSIKDVNTIVYYPLDIYRYFIGRPNQSISKQSYIRNYKQHEKIVFNIINFYCTNKDLSEEKKVYIAQKLIIPLLVGHYTIIMDFLKSPKEFRAFEKKLKKYPDFYNDAKIATRLRRITRKTNGIFIRYYEFFRKVRSKIF